MYYQKIRKVHNQDMGRIAEIEIFNYRVNFYPIFKEDQYYFDELQVSKMVEFWRTEDNVPGDIYVYDDGVIKGFVYVVGEQIKKLFVEPVLQGNGIGRQLLEYAVHEKQARFLWALEKNERAISFYLRQGFSVTKEKILEEGTSEFLVKLIKEDSANIG